MPWIKEIISYCIVIYELFNSYLYILVLYLLNTKEIVKMKQDDIFIFKLTFHKTYSFLLEKKLLLFFNFYLYLPHLDFNKFLCHQLFYFAIHLKKFINLYDSCVDQNKDP